MAHVLFIILVATTSAFFLWRMKVDPLAVAFGASVVYFMPGLFGVAQFSHGAGLETYSEPIVPGAYGAMALVLVPLTAVALATDRIAVGPPIRLRFEKRMPAVLLAFTIISGLISIRNTGVYYLCLDKSIILNKIDVWYYYASFSVPFCIAVALRLRQWTIVAIGMCFLVADLYAGFRWVTAITFLAFAMLMGDWLRQGWRKAVTFAMIIVAGGTTLFIVKHLIVPAKYATASYCEAQLALEQKLATRETTAAPTAGQLGNVAAGLDAAAARPPMTMAENLSATAGSLSHSQFYFAAFVVQSEAFVIQSILNEVVRKNFHTDAGYLIGQILTGLPLGASVFGIDSSKVVTFNAAMQPALFPNVNFGMANNPWAQAYAAGGLWMVTVFAVGYALIAGLLSLLFYKTAGALRAAVAVIGACIGFYFHRNDLFIEAILVKHVVYVCAASILAAWAWDRFVSAARRAYRGRTIQ